MKKNMIVAMVLIVSMFSFSGCNGTFEIENDPYYVGGPYNGSALTTLYLVDEYGNSYGGVPYICDSMVRWSSTAYNGEFTFYPPDDCEFDFSRFAGDYGDYASDIVRIVDYRDDGKSGIPYDCASFGRSSTDYDGSFNYNANDECVFYL
ncbi:MAG: hypothetical protein QM493_00235 [Sulfurovum sp.]